jgi:3'-5' exoribonuclease
MTRRFIADLQPGERIEDEVFLVRSKDLRTTTQGGLYIHAVLVDRSGQLVARAWQASEDMFQSIPEGGFVRLKGRTENYKGNLQFIIDAMRPAEAGSFDVGDFIPATKHDVEQMFQRVLEILRGVKDRDLLALVSEFVNDQPLMERFKRSPAAMNLHHAYIGGLLEHTLALLELGLVVIPRYPQLNLDLVLVGLFLHDIGKTAELSCDANIAYTDEGQLIGHITQAAIWIDKKADAAAEKTGHPFPDRLRWTLEHIVLSHHGRYEFGSPRLPAIPEAIAIHHLDNLDAKVNQFLNAIDSDRDPESHWTEYQRALETRVFKPEPTNGRGG